MEQTQRAPFEFRFSIVDSDAINAFATPGGYIYINKGLILASENESELAGVVAHEIAHANARHVASIIEKSQKLSVATLAAIIAGAFLGGGGEATAAIAAFSVAGASSLTLKYTRAHEEEADRLGLSYLVSAGYDPAGMIDFLKIMKQNEFLSKTMPSYLLTHPGTDDRIYYMDSLILTQYHQKGKKNIIGNLSRMQSLIPLNQSNLSKKYNEIIQSLIKDPHNVDLLYYLAIIEDQLGQTGSALKHFQKALSLSPRDEDILKNIGLIYLKTGKADLAQDYLLRASNLNPDKDEITLALGKAYFASGKYQNALDCYLKLKDKVLDNEDINYFIAMTYGKLNNRGDSHYYFGLHFKKEGKKKSALFHFKEAVNYFPQSSDRNSAINQEIKDLEKSKKQTPPMSKPTR
ncbi:exported zinc metalloprotease yfgc precursor [hydrocarbon metagenome]|uniref:Exported zinc metalloprotease yfgc n=1 Tax=hydrocarbon metagenome TaxID=938273 RepID=A0A0W8FMM1_9ZZZZ